MLTEGRMVRDARGVMRGFQVLCSVSGIFGVTSKALGFLDSHT